ncbi:aldo/keto reductase [Amaricoccus tamworthensis]|uniref:aldo/keto reductase n=1 Tax=Amaricoccus tamworthensis TaxID=57002 RepID=UPI003C79F60D
MHSRKLGPDGPPVSSVGIGGMSFGPFYGETTEAESHAILDAAREAGIDHIDTSNVYGAGRSEEVIGCYLARLDGPSPFRIATKGGITTDPDTGARRFDNSAAHLKAELDKSLKRLGVDQVELYYVHRRDPDIPIEEVTGTLANLIAKGKIARFGFSEIAPTSLRRAAQVHPVAAVQSEYSLQTRAPELGLIQACEELGTALVAFCPVGRGLLTDTPPTPQRVEASGFLKTNPRFTSENLPRNIAASQPLRDLARDLGHSTAALAIAWLLTRSETVIPIPGTRSTDHFRELVAGANLSLDADTLAEIDRHLPPGWCHGARYSAAQSIGPEDYC